MKNFVLTVVLFLNWLPAHAAITLLDKDQWKVSLGGFVELDTFYDSTRSFVEAIGNNPVERPDALAGQAGRTQFSIRNTRLALTVDAPEADGRKTKGYLEFDLLGYDPSPGSSNTEAGFYNNPTFRLRHGYYSTDGDGFQVLVGQYWMMLGWQPYYFLPSVQVAPLPGQLYSRTTQVRGVKSVSLSDENTLQGALAVMRPPQRDAVYPGLEGGLRLALGGRMSGFTGGATGAQKTQPMSVAVSGAFREIAIPQNTTVPTGQKIHFPGYAFAADALLPVLASSDGKDPGNTLSLVGEYSMGQGYGDEFSGWTGNLPNPLNTVTTAPEKNVNLDAGIGGFDTAGNFSLVKLHTFNAHLQYHLPGDARMWATAGIGRLYSSNIDGLRVTTGKVPYNKEEMVFGNLFHDCTKQVRMGLEYAHVTSRYADGVTAHNNRYQLSAWFIF